MVQEGTEGVFADRAKDLGGGFGGLVGDAGEAVRAVGGAAIEKARQAAGSIRQTISEEEIEKLLSTLYQKSLGGIPKVSAPVDELASDYLSKYPTVERAAKALVANQIAKCTTSGFLSGLGGVITLPVAIPANVGSVMFVQMRMIAALAQMGGFDVRADQVQTMVYVCLTGKGASDILKSAGIKFGQKFAEATIKKIPGKALVSINQKVGFRFITKFGEKGIVNLGKLVPVAGGIIGGGFDLVSTHVIAKNAYRMFIEKEFPIDEDSLLPCP